MSKIEKIKKLFLSSLLAANFTLVPVLAQELKQEDLIDFENQGVKLNISKEELIKLFDPNASVTPIKLEVEKFSPESITLDDLLYEAIKNNLDLKIAEQNSKRAKWDFWQQFSTALPDLSASFGGKDLDGTFYLNSRFEAPVDEQQALANFHVNYRAFSGGKTTLLILAQRFMRKSVQEQQRNIFNTTLLQSIQLYNNLLKEQSALYSQQKALDQAAINLQLTKNYYEIGTGTYYEYLQASARYATAKQSLITQEASFRKAQIRVAKHLNYSLDGQYIIEQEEVEKLNIIDSAIGFEEFKKITLENNPNIAQSLYEMKALKRRNIAAYSQFLPKLDLYYDANSVGPDFGDLNTVNTFGFNTVLDFGRGTGLFDFSEIKKTGADYDRAKLEFANTKQEIETLLREAYLDFESARSNILEAKARLDASAEALRLSRARYENGIEIINNLLQSEAALSQAEVNMINSITNYNDAQAALAYLMGEINLEKILAKESQELKQPE